MKMRSRNKERSELIRKMGYARIIGNYSVENDIINIYVFRYKRDRKLRKYLSSRGSESGGSESGV